MHTLYRIPSNLSGTSKSTAFHLVLETNRVALTSQLKMSHDQVIVGDGEFQADERELVDENSFIL
jgi:hypothetical protein